MISALLLVLVLSPAPGASAASLPNRISSVRGPSRVRHSGPAAEGRAKRARRWAAVNKCRRRDLRLWRDGEAARSASTGPGERPPNGGSSFASSPSWSSARISPRWTSTTPKDDLPGRHGRRGPGGRADDAPPRRGRQMPLDYRMHSTGDRWQVYDLSIEGISLVANYRSQFNKIVRTDRTRLWWRGSSRAGRVAAPRRPRPEEQPAR